MTNANQDQSEHWNSDATVETWVVGQAAHDAMLAPFLPILLDAAGLDSGEAVLDVGCGCGADAPGPLALADPDRTRLLLRDAGWRDIELVPHETSLLLGGPGTLETAVEFLRAGSMGQSLLANVDTATAAIWLVTARP